MTNKNTQLGWLVPESIVEEFRQYCDDVGAKYSDSISAAMIIWQYLPATVQRHAHLEASGKPAVDKEFWDEFRRGLDDAILGRDRNQPDKG